VQITDDAVEAAVELSHRYITGRCLPDKAIDVIDEAGARVRIKSMTKPPDLAELEREIERLSRRRTRRSRTQDYERAAELRDKAEKLRKKKEEIQKSGAKELRKSTASSTRRSSPRSSAR
jgi:ATP-dependent Clp protease ATP-binding subunit ClpC